MSPDDPDDESLPPDETDPDPADPDQGNEAPTLPTVPPDRAPDDRPPPGDVLGD